LAERKIATSKIAVVGGESLLGHEVRELLAGSGLKAEIELVATDEAADTGILTEHAGEMVLMRSLEAADWAGSRIVVLAGSPESSKRALGVAHRRAKGAAIIDVTGALEDLPEARLRAPMVEPSGATAKEGLFVIAHPAAIALALFLIRLHAITPVTRAVVLVFEPASERGKPGLDELQQQTAALLSLKKVPKAVFDAQAAFNLLPEYGEDAPRSLAEVEHRIERHLASLLERSNTAQMPSLRVVHAPVFHGYSFSVWAELEKNPGADALAAGLQTAGIDVRGKDLEAPSNAGAAGQSGITVGSIAADRNDARACWFWIVADNLRLAGDNAVEVARGILE
jgi:aspartate-semialdehyde dehydrogenase